MKTSQKLLGYLFVPALGLAVLSGCNPPQTKSSVPVADAGESESEPEAPAKKGKTKTSPTGSPSTGSEQPTGSSGEPKDAGAVKVDGGAEAGPSTDGGFVEAGVDGAAAVDSGTDAGEGGVKPPTVDDPDGIDTEYLEIGPKT